MMVAFPIALAAAAPPVACAVVDLRGAAVLPPATVRELARTLDDDERRRAAELSRDVDRARFVVAHVALRRFLARAVAVPPEVLRFAHGRFGKPRLVDGAVAFSLAHSETVAVLACGDRELGVDVEDTSRTLDVNLVSAHACSPAEQRLIAAAPDARAQREQLLTLWARKEALLKAVGVGLSRDPRTIDVAATGSGPWRWTDPDGGGTLLLADLDLGRRHRAAIAVADTPMTSRER